MYRYHWVLMLISILLAADVAGGENIERAELRKLFLHAQKDKASREFFINRLENIKRRVAIEESYLGICYAYRAQEQESKWDKLKIALKARKHLNAGVAGNPKDPECRFLRFVLEHYLPSFLGLNKNIENDLSVVFANIHFVNDNPALKKEVLSFILKSNRCSTIQKEILEKELNTLK